MSEFTPGLPFTAGAEKHGFQPDRRFAAGIGGFCTGALADADSGHQSPDPIADAHRAGFAEGLEQGRSEAAAQAAETEAARERLSLALRQLDAEREEQLRLHLRDTVAVLCEATIAPLALDTDLLARRIEKAAAMLARADDERIIRLNPEDIPFLAESMRDAWTVEPDPALERGTLRIECATGGVEDGPATWRRTIAEALQSC